MNIVKVIPFSRGAHTEHLTYFSSKEIPVGSIVTIELRKKMIEGLVIESEKASHIKGSIKEAAYKLKKVQKVRAAEFFSKEFLQMVDEASVYFLARKGQVIDALTPTAFIESHEKLSRPKARVAAKSGNLKPEKLALQSELIDRLSYYKTFIRESFAKKQSVFISLPTIHEIELWSEALSKGIETYTISLHSELPKKEQVLLYNQIIDEEHPVLVIATPSYISIPRHDIGSIIIERESSGAYKKIGRPHLDLRTCLEILASALKAKLIIGDTIVRTETFFRCEEKEINPIAPLSFRLPESPSIEVVPWNMKEDGETFTVFSDALKKTVAEELSHKQHILLFTLRKGLAPITVCNDCGTTLLCEECGSPLVLYGDKTQSGRIFVCNKCKTKKSADTICKTCGSWNLVPLGIGTERVMEEVEKEFSETPVLRIDRETAKTETQGNKIINQFYKSPGGILVGTEMALFYLKEKVATTAIVSFDSLFSIPSFRMSERILHLLLALGSYTEKRLLIQTKNPNQPILEAIRQGGLLSFYRKEIKERERFGYPPYSTLIKITFQGSKAAIDAERAKLEEYFKEYRPSIFEAFIPKVRGMYVVHVVLKIPRQRWIPKAIMSEGTCDTELRRKLELLPPTHAIQVDPDDLL